MLCNGWKTSLAIARLKETAATAEEIGMISLHQMQHNQGIFLERRGHGSQKNVSPCLTNEPPLKKKIQKKEEKEKNGADHRKEW